MSTVSCECEHVAHFEESWATPSGNPGHKGYKSFTAEASRRIRTPYGTFTVCLDCARDCFADFSDVQQVQL